MRNDFAIFIMSYKRPNNIITLNTLMKCGYSGKYYIVVGDDDPTIDEYKTLYGDKVLIFNKDEIGKTFDLCDQGGSQKVIVYARNYCFEVAKQMGLTYFAQFDDDYTSLEMRYAQDNKLKVIKINNFEHYNFDNIVDAFIDFLDDTNALTVAFAQGGDLIGGVNGSKFKQRVLRKAMNSFFCRTDKPFKFFGRINEDVNTYVELGKTGNLLLTAVDVSLVQKQTQSNKGGMSETYNDDGTYLKSFYTVMTNPSCVRIDAMATDHTRIHHRINWNNAVPKIISSSYKK